MATRHQSTINYQNYRTEKLQIHCKIHYTATIKKKCFFVFLSFFFFFARKVFFQYRKSYALPCMWLGYIITDFVLSPSDLLDEGLKNIMTYESCIPNDHASCQWRDASSRHKKMPWSVEPCWSSHCPTNQLVRMHRPFACSVISSCSPELFSCPYLMSFVT